LLVGLPFSGKCSCFESGNDLRSGITIGGRAASPSICAIPVTYDVQLGLSVPEYCHVCTVTSEEQTGNAYWWVCNTGIMVENMDFTHF